MHPVSAPLLRKGDDALPVGGVLHVALRVLAVVVRCRRIEVRMQCSAALRHERQHIVVEGRDAHVLRRPLQHLRILVRGGTVHRSEHVCGIAVIASVYACAVL